MPRTAVGSFAAGAPLIAHFVQDDRVRTAQGPAARAENHLVNKSGKNTSSGRVSQAPLAAKAAKESKHLAQRFKRSAAQTHVRRRALPVDARLVRRLSRSNLAASPAGPALCLAALLHAIVRN